MLALYCNEHLGEQWRKSIQCLLFYILQFCIIFLPDNFTATTEEYFSLKSDYFKFKHELPIIATAWIYPVFMYAIHSGAYEKFMSTFCVPYFGSVLASCVLDYLELSEDAKFMEGIVEQDQILFVNQYYWRRGKLRMVDAFDPELELPFLECPICLFDFNNNKCPRILPQCGHTVCEQCLEKLLFRAKSFPQKLRFECPFCTKPSSETRLEDYPKNYALRDIIQELRKNRKKTKSNLK